jgi:molybdate transport system regulatory protein
MAADDHVQVVTVGHRQEAPAMNEPPDVNEELAADVEAGLHAGGVTFGPDDADLLRAVTGEGSLNGATAALGRSYSRAHKRLAALEDAFGELVDRERGGADGGGSELTPAGEALLARFERLRAAVVGTAGAAETVLPGTVVERDGELGVVETPAGRLRAVRPEPGVDGDAVQVSVRADAVTLQAADDAPKPDATSARNQLSGTVTAVDAGRSVATVSLDVGAGSPLRALLTVDSVERLGVESGARMVASFKATATRATPR